MEKSEAEEVALDLLLENADLLNGRSAFVMGAPRIVVSEVQRGRYIAEYPRMMRGLLARATSFPSDGSTSLHGFGYRDEALSIFGIPRRLEAMAWRIYGACVAREGTEDALQEKPPNRGMDLTEKIHAIEEKIKLELQEKTGRSDLSVTDLHFGIGVAAVYISHHDFNNRSILTDMKKVPGKWRGSGRGTSVLLEVPYGGNVPLETIRQYFECFRGHDPAIDVPNYDAEQVREVLNTKWR